MMACVYEVRLVVMCASFDPGWACRVLVCRGMILRFVVMKREEPLQEEESEQSQGCPADRLRRAHPDRFGQHVKERRPQHAPRGEAQIDLKPRMVQDRGQRKHTPQQADADDQGAIKGQSRQHGARCSPRLANSTLVHAENHRDNENKKASRPDFEVSRPERSPHHNPAATNPGYEGEAMSKLSEAEIHERLPDARGWERHGDMLVRTWQFPSFRRAIEFVNHVSALIEKTDHYPDIHVSFRNVRVEMSTHDVGGLTERDFALISQINTLPTDS